MRLSSLSLPLLLLSGTLAWCQQPRPLTESNFRRYQVYGGAAFTGSNPTGDSRGVGFGLAGNINHWAGVLGDFTVLRSSCCVVNTITVTDYLIGPRVSTSLTASGRLAPFADLLFGGQTLHNGSNHHSYLFNNGTGPAIALDGGMDLRIVTHLAIRGQLGYLHSRFSRLGVPAVYNDRWRAATYVVYRF